MSPLLFVISLTLAKQFSAPANLEISEIKARYSQYGPVRKSLEAVPGDIVHFSFRLKGIALDKDKKSDLFIEALTTDSSDNVISRHTSSTRTDLALGGPWLDGQVSMNLGSDMPPGRYTLSVTVIDQVSKGVASFERVVTCKSPEISISKLSFFLDPEHKTAGSKIGFVGQTMYFSFNVIGVDSASKEKLACVIRILDKTGAEVSKFPRMPFATGLAKLLTRLPGSTLGGGGSLPLNRPGEFQIAISVVDEADNVKTALVVPIRVYDP